MKSGGSTDMRTDYRPGLPPMPDRIKALPVSPHGYPVPWFTPWRDGVPDFRAAEGKKIPVAVRENRCWICGQPLGSHKTFAIGPMCSINRISSEPPSHRDCAQFAAQACPFMVLPKAQRRDVSDLENKQTPGIMIERNPGVTLLWTTKSHTLMRAGDGILFQLGEPTGTEWYSQGRAATQAEVKASFDTGYPILRELAEQDGPAALKELDRLTCEALLLLPRA